MSVYSNMIELQFYNFTGKTDPYVILKLGEQVIRSKKNSQTTVIGPPGEPIWNQVCSIIVLKFPVISGFNRRSSVSMTKQDSIYIS